MAIAKHMPTNASAMFVTLKYEVEMCAKKETSYY